MIFFSQHSVLIKKLLLQIQQTFIIQTSTDPPNVIPLLPYPQGMTTPKSPPPPKLIKIVFFPDQKESQSKVFPKNFSLFLILLLVKTLCKDPPQELSLVLSLESKTSHQPIQSLQTAPITLPLVPLNKAESIFPKNPSGLTHQNSPTPTLSLSFEFENLPHISQTSSLCPNSSIFQLVLHSKNIQITLTYQMSMFLSPVVCLFKPQPISHQFLKVLLRVSNHPFKVQIKHTNHNSCTGPALKILSEGPMRMISQCQTQMTGNEDYKNFL
ncbi:hypothetical protein O181_000009 [Austropuccinia psidii MF-1]|uniref:Uncharacterized protein n=1 Tax=Austropuccinia psidii MF-1 TaxID=1389203 RepID=A0A9Q3B7P5_9BASI|nr:hypothetical protein [Austropuccinia psidii MF-1]